MAIGQRSVATMVSGAERARLAGDPTLGAGNFLHRITGSADRVLDQPVVWTDRAWHSPWGVRHEHLTLLELRRVAAWYAGWYARLGVGPRDPVAVFTHSAVDLLASYVALTGMGAIAVLVNGSLPPEVVAAYVRRVGVVGLVTDDARHRDIRPLVERDDCFVRCFDDRGDAARASDGAGLPDFAHADADPVLITHSSGTTGVPKAVLMQHQNFFFAVRYRLGMPVPDGSERILSALPGSHNSAITMCMFALLNGIPIKLMSTQDADAVLAEIEQFQPSLVAGFSKTFADLGERDLGARDLRCVRMWWNSGDAAHEAHVRKLIAVGTHHVVDRNGISLAPGSAFTDGMGSSEMGHSLFYNVHRPGSSRFGRCVGQPFKFVEAAVLSEDGRELPAMQVGRLGVKSPTRTSGYWNDSLLTWRSQVRGYWLTGDLVYRDADGWFYHLDRVSDAIDTEAGTMYSLQAEELVMSTHPEVMDCTVIGVPASDPARAAAWAFLEMRSKDPTDPTGGLVPRPAGGAVGVPTPRDPASPIDPAAWRSRLNELLGRHTLPPLAHVVQVARGQLPVGVTGKVKKRELRARWREFAALAPEARRPASPAEGASS